MSEKYNVGIQIVPLSYTVIKMVWESGGRGMFGLPMEISEVDLEILKEFFPVFVFYLHL